MSSGGTCAAAASSTKKIVRLRPFAAGRRHAVIAGAGEGETERGRPCRRRRAPSRRAASELITGRVSVTRSGGGLGESRTATHGAVGDPDLGPVGEQRRDVRVGPDAEEADVERRPRRAVVARGIARARPHRRRPPHPGRRPRRSRRPRGCSPRGCRARRAAPRAPACRCDRRAPRGTKRSSLHQKCTRDQSIAVAPRVSRRGGEHRRAHRPAGERDVHEARRRRRAWRRGCRNRAATESARAVGSGLITTRFSVQNSAIRLL